MCKNEKRTHGTAATGVPVAEMLASEARRSRTSVPDRPRHERVRRPLSMPFPGRSIERVLRDLATPSKQCPDRVSDVQHRITVSICVHISASSSCRRTRGSIARSRRRGTGPHSQSWHTWQSLSYLVEMKTSKESPSLCSTFTLEEW